MLNTVLGTWHRIRTVLASNGARPTVMLSLACWLLRGHNQMPALATCARGDPSIHGAWAGQHTPLSATIVTSVPTFHLPPSDCLSYTRICAVSGPLSQGQRLSLQKSHGFNLNEVLKCSSPWRCSQAFCDGTLGTLTQDGTRVFILPTLQGSDAAGTLRSLASSGTLRARGQ